LPENGKGHAITRPRHINPYAPALGPFSKFTEFGIDPDFKVSLYFNNLCNIDASSVSPKVNFCRGEFTLGLFVCSISLLSPNADSNT
jgi:hypothetical protein